MITCKGFKEQIDKENNNLTARCGGPKSDKKTK